MEENFEMSDLGLLAYYLGIEVTQNNGDISIRQSAYASKILKEAGMIDCNETLIPMDPGTRLTKTTKGTMVNPTEGNKIHGYSDNSYGVNTQEGKGTTGIIFYYGESPISWSTQKQATVALSSCESEFIAATTAATQALWLKRLLSKLTNTEEDKVAIKVDNKSTIALMKSPVFHGRSKHIDTKYHFIRECVEREDIQVEFVSGEYQKADILTKALPKIRFLTMRQLIGLKNLRSDVFPLLSKLDPSMYGPPESDLKKEHIISHLNGMSVQQLPSIFREENAQEGRKAYGTRIVFFLTSVGTLKPIAIELSLPPSDSNIPLKKVLTPPIDATTNWLWQLAKVHVCSNDARVHQLIHHWLRGHACMEPFTVASYRHLSSLHPVFKLLIPHITEMACAAYRDWWRFDLEGLPKDLIRRGMAVPDETKPHGLRLLIEDYPYGNDGLLIWSAIQELVQAYVTHFYPNKNDVISDTELQSCNLMEILTILIWTSSAQHAALNFGQYHFGAYVPNRPPFMRKLIPQQYDLDYASFIADLEGYFLACLPSLFQSTRYMAVIDIISAHSHEKEYLGEVKDVCTSWPGEPKIIEVFYRFSVTMKKIENEIKRKNIDPRLRNRCGAGVPPYELLVPTSEPGVTGRVQNVQGRQSQGYGFNSRKGKVTGLRVINIVGDVKANQPRIIRCYNFKVNEDDVNVTYDLDILSEVLNDDTYHETDMLNHVVQETEYFEHLVSNNDSYNELTSNSNVISYAEYMVTIKTSASQSVPSSEQKMVML
nr:linoleate 13S-lipoxygenase 3-1, chloroplastic [Tanacetum cinerariifolium]